MLLKKIALTLVAVAASLGAAAQGLPKNHIQTQQSLLAHQTSITAGLGVEGLMMKEMRQREAAEPAADVFKLCWNQSVNAYRGVNPPQTKSIDVRGFHFPLKSSRVTSPFGYRASFGRMHNGVDLALRTGDTIFAAFSGVIRVARTEPGGYGNYIVIRHDNGLETVYGHMSKFIGKANQRVHAGQPIGLGGSTGRSTGPHLHLETRYYGIPINPAQIIDFGSMATHMDVYSFNRSRVKEAKSFGPKKKSHSETASAEAPTPKG